jgi:hypothetical protein
VKKRAALYNGTRLDKKRKKNNKKILPSPSEEELQC